MMLNTLNIFVQTPKLVTGVEQNISVIEQLDILCGDDLVT